MVVEVGVPSQVVERIVSGVVIQVTTLHPFGAWPDESLEDQAIEEFREEVAVPAQGYSGSALFPVEVGIEFMPGVQESGTWSPFSARPHVAWGANPIAWPLA